MVEPTQKSNEKQFQDKNCSVKLESCLFHVRTERQGAPSRMSSTRGMK